MQTATTPQITKIHVLLSSLGITEQKAEIVYNLSNGRTESTKQLTVDEARRLISSLSEYDPKERIKSVIFSLAYKCGIIYGSTADDKKNECCKTEYVFKRSGSGKKLLNDMTYIELVKTHRQFEAMLTNANKSRDNKEANKIVGHLLSEINLTVK
jgi:hypothetical protein